MAADGQAGHCRRLAAETRGARTPNGFLAPLDTPNLPLDATPFGCASKSEGPTDVFGAPQASPLIEAELFAATEFVPCTGWPRTVMRGELRKANSGHYSHT